ncbi:hypothetical protein OUZ56_020349 [Daphnia magna]|uniref:Uncharacterized protein n=1 Tax=Daphnia magna TaxID=35525 RepID=A0ABQ9ZE92_9CRUS|nr:hypothetical protein OUZ56_020349 [Daphnia magna]
MAEAAGSCKPCLPESYDVATLLEDVNPPLILVAGASNLPNISEGMTFPLLNGMDMDAVVDVAQSPEGRRVAKEEKGSLNFGK